MASARDIEVRPGLVIPGDEIEETASRSSGPGGQHVNKTETRVTLRWAAVETRAVSPETRARLLRKLGRRLTQRGHLVVHAQRFRSRVRNRELARERLAELVREALVTRKARRPTRQSRASKERGVAAKKHRGAVKRLRGRPRGDE
jgi:ribosome-associated protein